MYKVDNVFKVFRTSIGNNRDNDYDDVTNAKHKFKNLGYYKNDFQTALLYIAMILCVLFTARWFHFKTNPAT